MCVTIEEAAKKWDLHRRSTLTASGRVKYTLEDLPFNLCVVSCVYNKCARNTHRTMLIRLSMPAAISILTEKVEPNAFSARSQDVQKRSCPWSRTYEGFVAIFASVLLLLLFLLLLLLLSLSMVASLICVEVKLQGFEVSIRCCTRWNLSLHNVVYSLTSMSTKQYRLH